MIVHNLQCGNYQHFYGMSVGMRMFLFFIKKEGKERERRKRKKRHDFINGGDRYLVHIDHNN